MAKRAWKIAAAAVLGALLGAMAWGLILWLRPGPEEPPRAPDPAAAVARLNEGLSAALKTLGVDAALVQSSRTAADGHPVMEVFLPRALSLDAARAALLAAATAAGGGLDSEERRSGEDSETRLWKFTAGGRLGLEIDALEDRHPWLALLVDDWGYSDKPLPALLDLPSAVSLAVFPGQAHSRDVAEAAFTRGHEILVHLPMEPHAKLPLVDGTLLDSMSDSVVAGLTESHWLAVPHASGVNNHEGSKGTEDGRIMRLVLGVLKTHGAFFVDSLTSPRSVAGGLAAGMGVRTATRQIFLDNVDQDGPIQEALNRAERVAINKGTCLAIGHPHKATLRVLGRSIPALAAKGIVLVPVSALVR